MGLEHKLYLQGRIDAYRDIQDYNENYLQIETLQMYAENQKNNYILMQRRITNDAGKK